MSGELQRAQRLLDQAKREPAHTPTEDALIDAVEEIVLYLALTTSKQDGG